MGMLLTALFMYIFVFNVLYRRPFGTDREFFVQLFMEPNENLIPQTERLLSDMFKEQNITFAKVTIYYLVSCFQMSNRNSAITVQVQGNIKDRGSKKVKKQAGDGLHIPYLLG